MEILGTAGFIALIVIALTGVVKRSTKGAVSGNLTVIVAVVLSIVVSLLTNVLGLPAITIAQAIGIGLGAVGIHLAATSVNTNTTQV